MFQELLQELETIDLGDKRLNRRSKMILKCLAADTAGSINASFETWKETKAAYDFFDNPQVRPEGILLPHREATIRRVAAQEVVVIVQDTTDLDYSRHRPRDAGVLDKDWRFGLYSHEHVAFTLKGLCLGVLGCEFFDRTPESLGKTRQRKHDPIETKESFRWLQGYRLACDIAGRTPQTKIVSVADCECDIYDIFLEVQAQDTPADFVIRAKQDRCTPEPDPSAGPLAHHRVLAEVAAAPLLATRTIELPRTPKRAAREATLAIRAANVWVRPPANRRELPEVNYNVVLVEEVNPPNDGTNVGWLLITTLPIETAAQVFFVIDCYLGRWPIETFFRVFKTGCRVEEIQLETKQRLKNALMFYKIISWRILYATMLGRECPELACDQLFSDHEWKPVWKIVSKTPLPKTAPSLAIFIPMLASLGGYNNRKHDRPPGPQVMWVAMRRMFDLALAWCAIEPQDETG